MADHLCSLTAHAKINPISDCGRCSVNARSSDRHAASQGRDKEELPSGAWPHTPDGDQPRYFTRGKSDRLG